MKYIFREQENLFLREGAEGTFGYRDHESAEAHLYSTVQRAADKSSLSKELAKGIKDWPSRAHLSPLRGNLLRPFASLLTGNVLEVGSGCGALTRVLGECGATVTALEPTYTRARICAERTRDQKNVRTVCDSLASFETEERFDVVLVVGVLEYATAYGDFDSFESFLARCRSFLKPDGLLFVAIENQLGVKYLGGTREDHLGRAFISVNDAYQQGGVRTFSRRELTSLLNTAGFPSTQFFAPLPDYKLPIAIVSEEATKYRNLGLDLGTLLHGFLSKDPQLVAQDQTFSLEQAFKLFARNENAFDVTNSFLVIASQSPSLSILPETLAVFSSVEIREEYRKETRLVLENGALRVKRHPLSPQAGTSALVKQVLEETDFIPGKLASEELLRILNTPQWDVESLVPWCQNWIAALERQFALSAQRTRLGNLLRPEALDATPFNLIEMPSGETRFFDLEWQWCQPVELGWVLVRGLFHSLVRISSVEKPATGTPVVLLSLIEELLKLLELPASQTDLQRYFALEQSFLQEALGEEQPNILAFRETYALQIRGVETRKPEEFQPALESLIERRFSVPGADLSEKLDSLSRKIEALEADYERTQQELARAREEAATAQAERDAALAKREALQQELIQKATPRPTVPQGLVAKVKPKLLALDQQYGLRESTKQFLRTKRLVEESKLFDEEYYLATYPEVAWSGLSPIEHYLRIGGSEGHRPSLYFDPQYYLDRYPDVAELGMNPFLHYIEYGAKEHRSPCRLFDSQFYIGRNPDVAAIGMNPLRHFLEHGWREGRDPHPDFHVKYYISMYRDVRETGKNPLEHFLQYGGAEGRRPNPSFDSGYYLRRYPDVKASEMNPLEHYLMSGRAQGRKTRPPAEELRLAAEEKYRSGLKQRGEKAPELNLSEIPSAMQLAVTGPLGISVVMPTYNRQELLQETLEYCRAVEGDLPIEYIIIDDGSSDGTAAFLESRAREWSHLTYRVLKNGGPGRARNVGASLASKEIVLFLGDDIQPLTDDFFRTHLRLHEKCRYRNFGVLGKAIWPWLPSERFTYVMGHIQGHGGEQFGYADLIPYSFLDWRFFYTCNVSVKRSIVENWEVEGFSTEFPFAAFEDAEFAYRMTKRRESFHLYYDPSSIGQHRHEYDVDGFLQRQQKAGMMASVLLRLHPELAEELYLSPIVEALNSPTTIGAETHGLDYRTFIEGAKALTRIVGRQSLLGTQSWHDALLAGSFGAAFLQGMLMNWSDPSANYAAAYQKIFQIYFERMRGELHVAFGELAHDALRDLVQNAEPPAFWM